MVAASRWEREADLGSLTGTNKPAGLLREGTKSLLGFLRENMQHQQARGRILAYPSPKRKVRT
jgi:hypothetical protein